MKLTHVSIDHFGRWENLDLPLAGDFSLFYGPNEAGKSTLLRFVRGVLFGFIEGTHDAAGELRVEHGGRTHTIRREADGSTRGLVTVSNVGQGEKAERWIGHALGGVGEQLFETVFAIGLNELQEIASLDEDRVAESIYGLSLGPEGDRVMRAASLLQTGRERLLDSEGRGELASLIRRRQDIDAELARVPDAWERCDKLTSEQHSLREQLATAERKREELRHDRRGMQFMERVYAPWRKQQQLIEERDRLGLHDFPLDAPDRLLTIEQRIRELEDRRREQRTEDGRLKREYERISERPELVENACRVNLLVEQEKHVRELQDRLKDLATEEKEVERRKSERMREFDLASFDETMPPPLHQRSTNKLAATDTLRDLPKPTSLLAEADAYRKVGRRYKSRLKRFRSAEAKQKRRSSDLKTAVRNLGAKSLNDAITEAEKQLNRLEKVRLLVHRERLLELQLAALKKARKSAGSVFGSWSQSLDDGYDEGLPQLFGTVIFIYIAGGIVCLVGGVGYGIYSAAWLGALWALLGLATLGTGLFLREYLFGSNREGGSTLDQDGQRDALREVESELRKTRQELDRLDPVGDSGLLYRGARAEGKPQLREQVDRHVEQGRQLLVDLKALTSEEDKLRRNREVLSRMRTSLRGAKQTLHNAKQAWARALRSAGLRETLKIPDALEAWQSLQTDQYQKAIETLTNELDEFRGRKPQVLTIENVDFEGRRTLIRSELDRFDDGVADLAVRLGETRPASEPFVWLRRLKEQVDAIERQKAERVRLRKERKAVRTRLDETDSDLARHKKLRSEIYAEAGVTTRDEFEARAQAVSRASLLATQIDEVRQEVTRISQSETELAIVEDDLMAFDAAQNKRAIESTNRELSQLDEDVQSWRERLGRVEAELEDLIVDRSAARLRFDREQVTARLDELASDYLAAGVAIDALDGVREQVEQNCQPATLQRAARYLEKLTEGKYTRIWTQLGRREILVSGNHREDWTVGQLSTGTREQLFLAIRLAMAEEFAEQGAELPIVLDDVLVNFDQHRTEAAIDTLIDVSETGQQVLMFSCHLHVASLLEKRGLESVTLPGSSAIRLAG